MARASLIFLNATVLLSHQVFRFKELITLGVFSFAHSRNRIVIVADGSFQWLTSLFTTISYQNWIWRVNSRELTLGRSTTSCIETQWKKKYSGSRDFTNYLCLFFFFFFLLLLLLLLLFCCCCFSLTHFCWLSRRRQLKLCIRKPIIMILDQMRGCCSITETLLCPQTMSS